MGLFKKEQQSFVHPGKTDGNGTGTKDMEGRRYEDTFTSRERNRLKFERRVACTDNNPNLPSKVARREGR